MKTLETRQAPGERHALKIRLIRGLYERGLSANDARQLFRLIDWIMDLPKPLEAAFWQEVKQYEQEKHMPFMTTPERIGREEGLMAGNKMLHTKEAVTFDEGPRIAAGDL